MTNEPIDWTQPICLDTVPPRMARVVGGPTRAGNYDVEANWGEPYGLMSLFVGSLTGCVCGCEHFPRVRNVRPGDFEPAPDLAAELAEALQTARDYVSDTASGALVYADSGEGLIAMAKEDVARIDAALAKWDARK